MITAYEGEWEQNLIVGNGILRRIDEDFKLIAKFKKDKIVGEF